MSSDESKDTSGKINISSLYKKRSKIQNTCTDVVLYTGISKTNIHSRSDLLFYELLGVRRKASLHSIRVAYCKRARELHPDKNGGTESSKQQFLLVQRAYSVLSDPNKRAIYDRFGMMGLDVAENCNKDQQDYMSGFAQNSSWPILLTCLGLLTCCFCCYCCCGCCMFCRRDSIPQGLVKEKPKVKDESIIAGTIVGD